MKCVKHGDKIIRVSNNEAARKVSSGWFYVPKSAYKKQERPHGLS